MDGGSGLGLRFSYVAYGKFVVEAAHDLKYN